MHSLMLGEFSGSLSTYNFTHQHKDADSEIVENKKISILRMSDLRFA